MRNKLADSVTSNWAINAVEKMYDLIDWTTRDIEPTVVYMMDDDGEYNGFKVKCHYCMYLRGAVYGVMTTAVVAGLLWLVLG